MDDATLNFKEDFIIADSLSKAAEAAVRVSVQAGLSSEVAASQGEAARSAVAKAAIVGAIAGRDITRATELFDEFAEKDPDTGKATLEGDDLTSTAKFLATAVGLEAAQEHADVAVALSTLPDGTIDVDTAKGLLRETPGLKGKPLADALTQLDIRIAEQNAIKDQRMVASESNLNQHLAGGGDLSEWTSKNPNLWEELQSESGIAKRIQDYREFQARGQQFNGVSDATTWRRLLLLPTEDLARVDLEIYKGQLTEGEYISLTRAQAAAGGGSSGEVRAIFSNARNIMKRTANTIPSISDRDETTVEESAQIRNLLERRMDEFVQSFTDQSKEPSQKEIGAEATRLVMNVQTGANIDSGTTIFGWRFGEDEDFFSGIAAQRNRMSIESQSSVIVPQETMTETQKSDWTTIYRNRGIEPTDKMLEQLGGAIAMNDPGRLIRLLTPRVKESE